MAVQRINIDISDDTHRLAKALATVSEENLEEYLAKAIAKAIDNSPESQNIK